MKLKSVICFVIVAMQILGVILFAAPISYAAYNEQADAELPSEYCMRDEYIVYAQNQDELGYCWNFAATMAAATTIMKATGEYYDFSELWTGVSLFNCTNKHDKIGKGGTISYQYDAMKTSGLMLECDLPYQYSYTISNDNAVDYYNFYEKYSNDDLASCIAYDSQTRFSKSDVEGIKRHIYEHGSIYLTFTFRSGFKESDGAYYLEPNQKNTTSNHAVSVIGWDDNYQKEFYLDGSDTPTVFKGAWIILNSYTEKNGNDGISFVFYDDKNIGTVNGYRYEMDTSREMYFYDKIDSGYAYPTNLVGKYYGDFTAEVGTTKQKNIFYDDVNLVYSYTASSGVGVKSIDIYLDGQNVTDAFDVSIDNASQRFYISANNAEYGQYKVLVTYGNGEKSDTYLNNFFVTHGLFGEEIEFDYAKNDFAFNPGRDLEFLSFISSDKNYVIYTNKLSGEIVFLPTEQSVYSEKNMSIPNISYEITNGNSVTSTYTITSNSGYELNYNFIFEYYEDTLLQPVRVYYDLGGGINHDNNYSVELGGPNTSLVLYEPTRPGYTFAGWYLDYGNGSKKLSEKDGCYYVDWDDIHHMGESPELYASSYYKKYYKNSNTVFVYARWEEEEYHTVDLTIIGEGTSQISEDIVISSNDSVRYVFKNKRGWCLSELKLNGVKVSSDDLVEIARYGLVIKDANADISITATFSEGVYLSLKHGENIKSMYVIGSYNGVSKKFYDGDFIPAEYFSSTIDRVPNIKKLGGEFILNSYSDKELQIGTSILPSIQIPISGSNFTLVVELFDDNSGYTYVLDDIDTYSIIEKGVFGKAISIGSTAGIKEITIGSAKEVPVERAEVTYSVSGYVIDHYLAADKNAKDGSVSSISCNTGDLIYIFIKAPADTEAYKYTAPTSFEAIGDGWYRKAIYVSSEMTDLGCIVVSRSIKSYTVTWKNWDGSVIYTEEYRYGSIPVFNNKNAEIKDRPVKPDDDTYSYIFVGWDKDLSVVTSNITYTAVYEPVLRRYHVSVSEVENGLIATNGDDYLNCNESLTYIFTPYTGYKVKDVIINGQSVGAVSSYTFSNVNSDQTLCVIFEKIQYSINVICGENGSTDKTGTTQIEYGSSITVNISAHENFAIDTIKVNGVTVDITSALTLAEVTENCVIEVYFKQIRFGINTKCTSNGSVTPSSEVDLGESIRVDFSAKPFCKVKDVKIDGVSMGAIDYYTFANVSSDHTVFVEYEIDALLVLAISMAVIVLLVLPILTVVLIKRRKRPHTKYESWKPLNLK